MDSALATPAPVAPLAMGQILDRKYRVGAPLGGGAMGLVYEAQHLLLQKPVAIKVLRPELAAMDDVRERFEAEARAAAAIGHPNIISVTDMGRTPDGAVYFVMDRLRGETLGERLERGGRMSPAAVVAASRELLSGLGAAHELGLIHRDIKPDNIFFAQSPGGRETPRILDFGVAKALASVGKRAKGTRAGFTVGTPQYMAPEQAAGAADVDVRVDIYAMGVVMYHMLAGRPPFEGNDVMQVLTAVVEGAAPPLSSLCREAPAALIRLVESAMHKDRNRRPSSAGELATRLQAVLSGNSAAPDHLRTPTPITAPDPLATFPQASAFKALASPVLVDMAKSPRGAAIPSHLRLPSDMPDTILELDMPARPVPAPSADPAVATAFERTDPATPVTPDPLAEIDKPPRKKRRIGLFLLPLPVLAVVAFFVVPRPAGLPAVAGSDRGAAAPAEKAQITFQLTPTDSELLVDGKPSTNPAELLPGSHRIVVKAAGFGAKEVDVEIVRNRTIEITLEKRAPEGPPRSRR